MFMVSETRYGGLATAPGFKGKNMKQKIEIAPELLDTQQVYEYLGCNIGINTVYELMKYNIIESVELGEKRKYITRRSSVDFFINKLFKQPLKIAKPKLNTTPVSFYQEFAEKSIMKAKSSARRSGAPAA